MEKIYFTEKQKFDQVWFRVIIFMACVPLIVIFGVGLYRQLVIGKPWGNHPAPDSVLLITTIFVFLVMAGLMWLIFSMRLITEVTNEGLRYRFPPLIFRSRTILKNDIAEYRIREYNPVREYGGWGIRQGSGNGTAYNVKEKTGLQLLLRNDKKILFGTQRPDALQAAMDKLMKPQLT